MFWASRHWWLCFLPWLGAEFGAAGNPRKSRKTSELLTPKGLSLPIPFFQVEFLGSKNQKKQKNKKEKHPTEATSGATSAPAKSGLSSVISERRFGGMESSSSLQGVFFGVFFFFLVFGGFWCFFFWFLVGFGVFFSGFWWVLVVFGGFLVVLGVFLLKHLQKTPLGGSRLVFFVFFFVLEKGL